MSLTTRMASAEATFRRINKCLSEDKPDPVKLKTILYASYQSFKRDTAQSRKVKPVIEQLFMYGSKGVNGDIKAQEEEQFDPQFPHNNTLFTQMIQKTIEAGVECCEVLAEAIENSDLKPLFNPINLEEVENQIKELKAHAAKLRDENDLYLATPKAELIEKHTANLEHMCNAYKHNIKPEANTPRKINVHTLNFKFNFMQEIDRNKASYNKPRSEAGLDFKEVMANLALCVLGAVVLYGLWSIYNKVKNGRFTYGLNTTTTNKVASVAKEVAPDSETTHLLANYR